MNRIKIAIYEIPVIKRLYDYLLNSHYRSLYKKSPRLAAEEFYSKLHGGKKPNLDDPQSFEEKNIWLALNTDTSLWTTLSDKFEVRKYVSDCGLSHILNELYAKWDSVDEIDFSSLPDEFVIKANNSCATVLIVKDKDNIDIKKARRKIRSWFKGIPYGYVGYNGHYLRIRPCIIAEKLLHDSKSSDLPIDYKFYCAYGKVFACAVMQNRSITNTHNKRTAFHDSDWSVIYDDNPSSEIPLVEKPSSYDEMVTYCHQLAKDFPLVRVDFYEINGKPIFGEMTFTSSVDVFSDTLNRELGKYIVLPIERDDVDVE